MSTNIDNNLIKNFILRKVGDTLDKREAKDLKIEDEYTNLADELDVDEIDLEDLLDDKDIVAQFTAMYVEDVKNREKTDDEKREEETKVKSGKNNAKA